MKLVLPRLNWLKLAAAVATLAVLVHFGSRAVEGKIALVRDIQHVGHADEAAYVTMAKSLVSGQGLNVPYVSWHFIPYPAAVVHREDHWPPFLAFAIAPFFWWLGVAPWVAKLAPIFIGSIGLPVATALLALAYGRRAYVALAAGLLMLLNPFLFTESLKSLSDLADAMLVAGFCAALLAARDRPPVHLAAGLLAALAYYAKGSELVLLGLYPVLAALACGWRSLRTRWPYAGMLAAFLLILPWMVSNTRLYGNPLHCTQNYVSGYIGLHPGGWEGGTYYPYLGRDLPQTSDRWTKYRGRYPQVTRMNAEAYTRWAVLGPDAEPWTWDEVGSWGGAVRDAITGKPAAEFWWRGRAAKPAKPVSAWANPACTLAGLASVGWVAALSVGAPLSLVGVWRAGRAWWQRRRKKDPAAPAPGAPPPAVPSSAARRWLDLFPGRTLALVLVVAVHWSFLVFLWEPYARLAVVMLPPALVLGCAALAWLAERPVAGALWAWERFLPKKRIPAVVRDWRALLGLAAAAVVLAVGMRGEFDRQFRRLVGDHPRRRGYPYGEQFAPVRIGTFLKTELPAAVIMARNPWEILFHAAPTNRGVTVPLASAGQILAVAKHYRVTHYVWETDRPALRPYLSGQLPGFRRVPNAARVPVYEILWDQLPPGAVDPWPVPPAAEKGVASGGSSLNDSPQGSQGKPQGAGREPNRL